MAKYETTQVNDRFKKREFVLELAEEINGNVYTNYAKMQLVQNKCEIIDRYNEGDQIKVSFNIKGNRWERDGKVNYITNLDAWRVEPATGGAPGGDQGGNQQQQAMPAYQGNQGGNQQANTGTGNFYNPSPENVDDLPF